MRTDRENWELAEALAPDVAAECGPQSNRLAARGEKTLAIVQC